jgi:uncharacterized protein YoxC
MGLFSRNHGGSENEHFDETDLPGSDDLSTDPFIGEDASPDLEFDSDPAPARPSYGIEQAVRLMKSLPRDNNEVVVMVVKKTLESTDIQVQDIIEDATAKEERLRTQQKQLEAEIKRFQEEISQRSQKISELLQDLKETCDVRQRLELAVRLEAGRAEKDARQKQATVAKTVPGNTGAASRTSTAKAANPQSTENDSVMADSLAGTPSLG